MASWVKSSYRSGRGAELTVSYSAVYDPNTNCTVVELNSYTVRWSTGGANGYCEFAGTLSLSRGDGANLINNTLWQSKNGVNPSVTYTLGQRFSIAHDFTSSKDIRLGVVTTSIKAANYIPDNLNVSERIHIADHQHSVVYIDSGAAFERYACYIDDGAQWQLHEAMADNGTAWENY